MNDRMYISQLVGVLTIQSYRMTILLNHQAGGFLISSRENEG